MAKLTRGRTPRASGREPDFLGGGRTYPRHGGIPHFNSPWNYLRSMGGWRRSARHARNARQRHSERCAFGVAITWRAERRHPTRAVFQQPVKACLQTSRCHPERRRRTSNFFAGGGGGAQGAATFLSPTTAYAGGAHAFGKVDAAACGCGKKLGAVRVGGRRPECRRSLGCGQRRRPVSTQRVAQ